MEAKDFFYRLSYEQYKGNKTEERARWETEVFQTIIEEVKKVEAIDTPFLDAFINRASEIELLYSNSFELEKIFMEVIARERNEKIVEILNNCWIAKWDLPDSKNACVETQAFYDGSYLIRINTEFILNLSRVVWLYVTVFILENVTPFAKFQDIVEFNVLKNKFAMDIKNDTDEGTSYYMESSLTLETRKMISVLIKAFYESGLIFVLMHEIGHIFELDDTLCDYFEINSSKIYKDLSQNERQRKAENNADLVGHLYSDEYINDDIFFNMGPVLSILTLAVNHKSIKMETNHPSLKSRYESALSILFKGKEMQGVLHTKKLLDIICKTLQDENCWSEDDKDWWKNEICCFKI